MYVVVISNLPSCCLYLARPASAQQAIRTPPMSSAGDRRCLSSLVYAACCSTSRAAAPLAFPSLQALRAAHRDSNSSLLLAFRPAKKNLDSQLVFRPSPYFILSYPPSILRCWRTSVAVYPFRAATLTLCLAYGALAQLASFLLSFLSRY